MNESFEIMVPVGRKVSKTNLPPGRELDGKTLKSIFAQKAIYIRPLQPITENDTYPEDEGELQILEDAGSCATTVSNTVC